MARINKADHAVILRKVEVEECKISDVAAEYGCSAANLYALLRKLRRAGVQPAPPEPGDDAAPVLAPAEKPAIDLFAGALAPPPPPPRPAVRLAAPIVSPTPPASARATEDITPRPKGAARGGVGAALAKPGYALAMRSPEGDENLTPFRSLDDLLSAVKPILRAAARNPDAIWFSIQPIDLASFDSFA